MCRLLQLDCGIQVADIKKKYIENIIVQAKQYNLIDKIVLFGSALEERCTDLSDIDIAVFGSRKKKAVFQSKWYSDFQLSLFRFDNSGQDYDILYFETDKEYKDRIIDDINNGKIIYKRGV